MFIFLALCKKFNFFFCYLYSDADECSDSPCPTDVHCVNQIGSLTCFICPNGYIWNGAYCDGKNVTSISLF